MKNYRMLFSFPILGKAKSAGRSRPKFDDIREASRVVPH
jgi:hypothetical protein